MDKTESYANSGKAVLSISEKFVFKGTLPKTLNPALDLYLIFLWSTRVQFLGSKYLLGKCWAQSENTVQLSFHEIYNRLSTPSDHQISLKSAELYRYHQESWCTNQQEKGKNSQKNLFVFLHLMYNQGKVKYAKRRRNIKHIFLNSFKSKRKCYCNALVLCFKIPKDKFKLAKYQGLRPLQKTQLTVMTVMFTRKLTYFQQTADNVTDIKQNMTVFALM